MGTFSVDRLYTALVSYLRETFPLLSRLLHNFPLIGNLWNCGWDDHRRTITDVINYLVWATMPFWLGALVLFVFAKDGNHDWSQFRGFLEGTFNRGELLILSTSLLAPAFSVALIEPKDGGAKPFPGKLWHATVVAILMIVCAALFAAQRANPDINLELLYKFSQYATYSSLFLFYLGALYNHNRGPNGPQQFRQDEREFAQQFIRHRERS